MPTHHNPVHQRPDRNIFFNVCTRDTIRSSVDGGVCVFQTNDIGQGEGKTSQFLPGGL